MRYIDTQKARASAWKASTATLPEQAREAAPYVGKDGRVGATAYPFCLPPELAAHNLLPEVRDDALALFAELQIPWHAGTPAGPSNHLLSSQVQCVNALGQMVRDPSRIALAFGVALDVAEVLEIEPGGFLTFEYIGPTDFFGEAPGGVRVRGAHCTSVDAAFLYVTSDGRRELALVEWKYTESYRPRRPEPQRDQVRLKRYGAALADPQGPLVDGLLPFEALCDEPFYQLARQQLLAWELEKAQVLGAERVRVVHVLSPYNRDYQDSLSRPEHHALGFTVSSAWQQLLRRPDRFVTLDPEAFCDPRVTSLDYVRRYSPRYLYGPDDLFSYFRADDEDAVADCLGFGGWVEAYADCVDLVVDEEATGLRFPFHLDELEALAAELESPDRDRLDVAGP